MGDSDELTPKQQEAVDADAPRICVGAGPGSGKTRVLVRRIADRVEDRRLDLGRTLALTFTDNAAGQMKQRLADRFKERGREAERRQVEQVYISTIHSFCARLLREHAIEAGLDPRLRVLDEIEANLLKARLLRETLDCFQAREPEAFEEFASHFEGSIQEQMLYAYDEIRRQGADPGDTEALLRTQESAEEVYGLVEARLCELEKAVKGQEVKYCLAVSEIRKCLDRAWSTTDLAEAMGALEQARKTINLQRLSDPRLKPSFRVLRGDDPEEGGPPQVGSLLALQQALVEREAAPHRRRIAELLAEFDRAYAAHKRRIAALDFDDLERRALRLLEDPLRAGEAAARFQEILVDEYQDTSKIQAEILERLAVHPRLFVVGDPKQSIYAFRNARPENFEEAQKRAPEEGRIRLRQDFRSRPEIIAAINTFFLTVWPSYEGLPLEAEGEFADKKEPSVDLLIVSSADKDGQERHRREAGRLARHVRELVERDGRDYGEVAMLFRSTTNMALYEHALRDEGIPYFAETGRGFYDAREVADVVNFLRLLDNARDEVALASVLRSPMFGLSDDALYLLAARAREQKFTRLVETLAEAENLGLPAADRERVGRFRALFARLRQESGWRPLDSLVRAIVEGADYETTLLLAPNGARQVANLRKLAEMARALGTAATGLDSPGDFARAVDQFRFGEVREGEAQLGLVSEGAVRLMTMHAAKGLEFPVVILPDLSRGDSPSSSPLDYWPEFGLGLEYKAGEGHWPTLTLEHIRSRKKVRDDEEERRVLFVAMTRAQEHLALSGSAALKKDGSCSTPGRLGNICEAFGLKQAGLLRPANKSRKEKIPGAHPFQVSLLVTDQPAKRSGARHKREADKHAAELLAGAPLPAEGISAATQEHARKLAERALAARAPADQADFIASVTDLMEFQACPRRYYLGRYLGFSVEKAAAPAAEDEDEPSHKADEFPPTELGRLVHARLAGTLSGDVHPEVERLARRFRESELGRHVAGLKNVRREEPIFGVVDGHFLRGALDLHAGDLIVDYKTGEVDTERYRLQMLLYALLTGAKEAVLFYLNTGQAVPVELTPEALEEARAAVGRFFEAQRRLDLPAVVEDHCFRCAFRGNLCREPQKQRSAQP